MCNAQTKIITSTSDPTRPDPRLDTTRGQFILTEFCLQCVLRWNANHFQQVPTPTSGQSFIEILMEIFEF